ncbi:hypothetical protein EK21DRAFT_84484 [Setomelanomma holmii]|uniref:Uncharacterized protein n=1 Tax=Setomelanomma holmii TaxID=210430 RepID=A0A9P4LU61_9PLEO|nr:hypothetical protein EK21DRAFT_84484 [Setomelanomma holmii]
MEMLAKALPDTDISRDVLWYAYNFTFYAASLGPDYDYQCSVVSNERYRVEIKAVQQEMAQMGDSPDLIYILNDNHVLRSSCAIIELPGLRGVAVINVVCTRKIDASSGSSRNDHWEAYISCKVAPSDEAPQLRRDGGYLGAPLLASSNAERDMGECFPSTVQRFRYT